MNTISTKVKNIVEIDSRKLDALEDIIESMNGKPLLVAYWYKHDYERIAKRLESLHIFLFQSLIQMRVLKGGIKEKFLLHLSTQHRQVTDLISKAVVQHLCGLA